MSIRRLGWIFLLCLQCYGTPLQLNPLALDPSLFNATQFATMSLPLSALDLPDGSFAITSYFGGIQRFTDTIQPGIADGPGTTIYSTVGAHTGLIHAGNFIIDGNSGDYLSGSPSQSISILKPGATPASPLTQAGVLQFNFGSWEHSQMGIAARQTPNQPGFYDLVFNVGSQFDNHLSTDKVQLNGLTTATLDGDSLYVVTLDLTGATPVASSLRKIATGIRNVIGMGFQPGTGDFYFVDNAINGPGSDGDEPPQAEEINLITAADFGAGAPINFGYPDCYIQYRTGATVGSVSGCVQPLFAIQPMTNGTPLGSESEGVTQLAFAPANFPTGFNNGIFLGFSGKGTVGPTNEENAVGYYDLSTGTYIHFSENSQPGVGTPIGIMTTPDALFISDYAAGIVYEVTSATPEPGSLALISLGLAALVAARLGRMRAR